MIQWATLREMGGGRLTGVGRLIEVGVPLIFFHYRVINLAKFLSIVNMESIQDNHDRRHSRRLWGS